MTLDEAFAAVSHAFPSTADWQGRHFVQANRNGVTIIEVKKSSFQTISTCPHCGQKRQDKDSKFFYWLMWEAYGVQPQHGLADGLLWLCRKSAVQFDQRSIVP